MLISREDGTTYVHDFVPDEIKLKPKPAEPEPAAQPIQPSEGLASVASEQQPTDGQKAEGSTSDAPSGEADAQPEVTGVADAPSSSPQPDDASPPPPTSSSLPEAAHAASDSAPAILADGSSLQSQNPGMVRNLPTDVLNAFGLLPSTQSLEVAPLLRFYR